MVTISVSEAGFTAGSAPGHAAVQLDIKIRNESDEPIEFLACGLRLQRQVAGVFESVYSSACFTPQPERLSALTEDRLTTSLQIESQHLDVSL